MNKNENKIIILLLLISIISLLTQNTYALLISSAFGVIYIYIDCLASYVKHIYIELNTIEIKLTDKNTEGEKPIEETLRIIRENIRTAKTAEIKNKLNQSFTDYKNKYQKYERNAR